MDMISSTTSNTTAPSTLLNKQEAPMVASPAREEEAGARNIKPKQARQQQVVASGSGERKPRPPQDQALNCPRCNSTNTKFCYYNNYSMTQPRYFCKACRRNWTQGGTLRNVPVGGGTRKNSRQNRAGGSSAASSSAPPAPSSSSIESKKVNTVTQQLLMMPTATAPMPAGFPSVLPAFMSAGGSSFQLPSSDHRSLPFAPLSSLLSSNPVTMPSFTDLLRGGFLDGSSGSNGMAAFPPFLPAAPSFGAMEQHRHGLIDGSSGQQMVGILQGVDQEVKPPMAAGGGGGSGLQQWSSSSTAQEQQAVGGDGSAGNNMDGGASGSSSGVERFWQGGFINYDNSNSLD